MLDMEHRTTKFRDFWWDVVNSCFFVTLMMMSCGFNCFLEGRKFVKLLSEWKYRNVMGASVLHIAVNTEDALEVLSPASKGEGIVREVVLSISTVSFSSNQSLFFFIMLLRMSSDVFRTADFRLSHKVSVVGSLLHEDTINFCCKSASNFAFTYSQHRLPMFHILLAQAADVSHTPSTGCRCFTYSQHRLPTLNFTEFPS